MASGSTVEALTLKSKAGADLVGLVNSQVHGNVALVLGAGNNDVTIDAVTLAANCK
jgi:hypothetical protein